MKFILSQVEITGLGTVYFREGTPAICIACSGVTYREMFMDEPLNGRKITMACCESEECYNNEDVVEKIKEKIPINKQSKKKNNKQSNKGRS